MSESTSRQKTSEDLDKALLGGTEWKGIGIFAAVLAAILLIEVFEPGGIGMAELTFGIYTPSVMVRIGIFSMIVVGLNILMGFAGQVSLGQAAFFGIGAYTTAIFTSPDYSFGLRDAWWWPWVLMVVGAAVAGGLAYVIGRPLLRLKGHYLAMGTLGFGIVVFILFRENFGFQLSTTNITGASTGSPMCHVSLSGRSPSGRWSVSLSWSGFWLLR